MQRDPLKVALPDGKPISDTQKTAFVEKTSDLFAQLDAFHNTHVAKLD
jgi:hypothetical protein